MRYIQQGVLQSAEERKRFPDAQRLCPRSGKARR